MIFVAFLSHKKTRNTIINNIQQYKRVSIKRKEIGTIPIFFPIDSIIFIAARIDLGGGEIK